MSEHALEVLEFGRVLERVAARAGSDLARDRVLALRPETDPATIARELGRVGAAMRFVEEDSDWGMLPIPDLTKTLVTGQRVTMDGSTGVVEVDEGNEDDSAGNGDSSPADG